MKKIRSVSQVVVVSAALLASLVSIVASLPTLSLGLVHFGNFAGPPWNLNAHGGGMLPKIDANGVLNTTTVNPLSMSYTGTYNSNVYFGKPDYSGAHTYLPYTSLFINGTFTGVSVEQSKYDYTVENEFYVYLPNAVSGTNCGSTVSNTHWLSIEIFYSGRSQQPPYVGCASAGDISYREVITDVSTGQYFQNDNFNITAVIHRAFALQGLPSTTSFQLSAVEVGTEGFGVNYVKALWYYVFLQGKSTSNPSAGEIENFPDEGVYTNFNATLSVANLYSPTWTLESRGNGGSCANYVNATIFSPNSDTTVVEFDDHSIYGCRTNLTFDVSNQFGFSANTTVSVTYVVSVASVGGSVVSPNKIALLIALLPQLVPELIASIVLAVLLFFKVRKR